MKPLEITPHERVYNLEGGHSDSVTCLAFSSKADLLASGSDDGSVVLWSLAKGLCHRSFKVKSPTGVTLYDLLTDKCMPALPGLTGYVDCIDINQEAGTMAIGIDSNVHVAKEVVDKRYAAFIQLPSPKSLNQDRILWSLHFLGDTNKVIVAYAFHGLTCWDVMTETALWRMDPEQFIMPIASTTLSRDGKTILVSHAGGLIRLFRLAQSTPLQSFFCETDPKENHPVTAAYLDGDKKVVSGSPAGEVYVWDAISGRHHQTLGHSGDIIQTVASTETNKYSLIATGNAFKGEKTRVVLWRASVKTAHRESMIIKAWTRLMWLSQDTAQVLDNNAGRLLHWLSFGTVLAGCFLLYVFRGSPWVEVPFSFLTSFCEIVWSYFVFMMKSLQQCGLEQGWAAKSWARKVALEFLEIDRGALPEVHVSVQNV